MRVVHLSCVAPPEIGGIGQIALREVVGLRARGIDAQLLAPESRQETSYESERSFVHRIRPVFRWGNGAILPYLQSLIQTTDIVHVHYPFYGTMELLLATIPRNKVVVMTFHMDALPHGIRRCLVKLHQRIIQPFLLSRANHVLVSSFDYARRSSLRSFIEAHPIRVSELPFGIDTEFFSPGPSIRARLRLPDHARVVLFVGGLDCAHSFKGLSVLLLAIDLLGPLVNLLIVGDGDMRDLYEREAEALHLTDRVHFYGKLDELTLRDMYRSADVFAFPSTTSAEAFGLVALEAQACGLPVVASSLPGVRTVVEQGETGLLVPPGDHQMLMAGLKHILTDDALRHRFSQKARAVVEERFSWETHLDKLIQVYQNSIRD